MHKELFAIAEKLGATCDKCKEVCCINMAGAAILQQNPRMLVFNQKPIEDLQLTKRQIEHLLDLKEGVDPEDDKEQAVTVCPFYEIKTHRCNIHKARPDSCQQYPFNYSEEFVDLRKVNACVISTRIVERFVEFAKMLGKDEEVKQVEEILKTKDYRNHFYLTRLPFYTYVVWECIQHNIPVVSGEIKEAQYMMAMAGMIEKKQKGDNE